MLWARGKEAQENIIGEAEVDVRKKSGEGEGSVRGNCERGGEEEKEDLVGEGKGGARKHYVGKGKG